MVIYGLVKLIFAKYSDLKKGNSWQGWLDFFISFGALKFILFRSNHRCLTICEKKVFTSNYKRLKSKKILLFFWVSKHNKNQPSLSLIGFFAIGKDFLTDFLYMSIFHMFCSEKYTHCWENTEFVFKNCSLKLSHYIKFEVIGYWFVTFLEIS